MKPLDVARFAFGTAARLICRTFAPHLPTPRVIYDREGGSPYLSRWYLAGRGKDVDAGDKDISAPGFLGRVPFSVFLHRFHRSDDDGALHSHPWAWSFSIILAGGYVEERRVTVPTSIDWSSMPVNYAVENSYRVVRRFVPPLSLNVIRHDDYHRVDLIDRDAWTIFVAGPKIGSWFFWDRVTGKRTPWREFIDRKRAESDEVDKHFGI